MDCCLVSMPFASLVRPSLGLGLLQAILEDHGFSVVTIYANLLWGEKTGLRLYQLGQRGSNLIGDWVFSPAAFPDFKPDSDEYLQRIFSDEVIRLVAQPRADIPEILAKWRHLATKFVDELARQIIGHEPLVVGCSTSMAAHASSLALLKRVRDLEPRIVTLMGGANCDSEIGLASHENFPWVDYVVSGEADEIIVNLIDRIKHEGRNMSVEHVPHGVFAPVHRQLNYPGLREAPPRGVTGSLDIVPIPNYDDYFATLERTRILRQVVRPGLPVEGSRGCWWGERKQCTFCGLNGPITRYRTKSPDRMFRELEVLRDRYGVERFGFTDNILNPRWFKDFFPQVARSDRSYMLSTETTPNVSEDQIRAMYEAGMRFLQPGIENLDSGILTLLNKASKGWSNVRFLKWCYYYGIYVHWWLLVNVPGEDKHWHMRIAEIVPNLYHLQSPKLLNPILPSRFSVYHRDPERYNLDLEPLAGYSAIYPLDENAIVGLAHYFTDKRSATKPYDRVQDLESMQGYQALADALVEWNRLFLSHNRPVLETHDDGTEIRVRDTRPVASREELRLIGEERIVYNACESGISPERLRKKMSVRHISDQKTDDIVSDLVDRRLVLFIDNHLLSLGMPKPVARVPNGPLSNCGELDISLYEALCVVMGLKEPLAAS